MRTAQKFRNNKNLVQHQQSMYRVAEVDRDNELREANKKQTLMALKWPSNSPVLLQFINIKLGPKRN